MITTWKQDFFTRLALKARSENCFIYNPGKTIIAGTTRLEIGEQTLSHTGWGLNESRVWLEFYNADPKKSVTEVPENKRRFESLLVYRNIIEKALCEPLEWDYMDGRKHQKVVCRARVKASADNRKDWPRIQDELINKTKRLGEVLKPYLQGLDNPLFVKRAPAGASNQEAFSSASVPSVGGSLMMTRQDIGTALSSVSNDQPLPEEYRGNDAQITALPEGAKKTIVVNAYERNPKARAMCLAHYGTNCTVCGFSFAQVYGGCGAGYIHVHHIKPISEIGESYNVDPVAHLRPVCPNCHAMLHASAHVLSIDELQARIKRRR